MNRCRRRNKNNLRKVLSVVMTLMLTLCLLPLSETKEVQASVCRSVCFGTSGVNGYVGTTNSQYNTIKTLTSPASGGKVSKTLNSDGSVTITASANKGYVYKEWRVENAATVLTTSPSYVVENTTGKITYIAYFTVDSNYSAKSGVTDESFQNTRRLSKDPNYRFTRSSMQTYAANFVAVLAGQYADAAPKHRAWGAISAAEAFFDKDFDYGDVDYDELLADHELISTEQEIMQVSDNTERENYEKTAIEYTNAKFGERYSTTVLTVKDIKPPIEGWTDGNRTLLWKGTGATYKDNIYIIYEQEDNQPKMLTGVVDSNGVIRFTVPSIGEVTQMAVVKAVIH